MPPMSSRVRSISPGCRPLLTMLRAGDAVSEITPGLNRYRAVADTMHDQCRHTDYRQNIACVDFAVHATYRHYRRRAGALAFKAGEDAAGRLLGHPPRHITG